MTAPARGPGGTVPTGSGAPEPPPGPEAVLEGVLDAVRLPAALVPPGTRPVLLRHGSSAVFALGGVVVRVTPVRPRTVADTVRALAIAQWLEAENFPAVRAVADDHLATPQPLTAGDHLITFWHSLGARPIQGSTADLGRLLRRFHALTPPAAMHLPALDPVARVARQLAGATALDPTDRAGLEARLADVGGRYAALAPGLPGGHLHGDATVANVVVDAAGRPTLVDLDLVRTGPRVWDLVRTAVYAHRLGWHTAPEYRDFCAAYGRDVAADPGFDVLADLTELLQIGWLAEAAAGRPRLATELAVRIASLQSPPPRHWHRV